MKRALILLTLTSLLISACGGTATPDLEATVQAAIAATQATQPPETRAPEPSPDIEATVQAAIAATLDQLKPLP
jgi:ABC-type glycerol-3-phosphate transport system substrate-binding protein